ncbi:MAG: hypothetical protein KDI75_11595 [Xanthomonadales bacterium]|nr:hypothetical protein [Xanthomonadales bacterium]
MKLRVQEQCLRVRVDEEELKQLLQGRELALQLDFGATNRFGFRLSLHDGSHPDLQLDGLRWSLKLPARKVKDYAECLPTRDPLSFPISASPGGSAIVQFEVDVRDSLRHRRPSARGSQGRGGSTG